MKKILIAYYSRRGQNNVNGSVINLEVGNTEVIAHKIQDLVAGDLFYIDTKQPYPEDYTEATHIAKEELNNGARPTLTAVVDNMEQYDTIFLGYPNWWGTFPMAVFTFLESYDFSGKTIIPFCTHEGGGLGKSEQDITKLCPNSEMRKAFDIQGSKVKNANRSVKRWIKKLR